MIMLPRAIGPSRARWRRRLMRGLVRIDNVLRAIPRILWEAAIEGFAAYGQAFHGSFADWSSGFTAEDNRHPPAGLDEAKPWLVVDQYGTPAGLADQCGYGPWDAGL